MKFEKQTVETGLIPLFTEDNKDRCWKIIEKAARVCYASYTMIKKEPDYEFLQRLYNNKHHSVFEHSNFVVASTSPYPEIKDKLTYLFENAVCNPNFKFLNVYFDEYDFMFISGNIRAWINFLGGFFFYSVQDITPTKLLEVFNAKINAEENLFEIIESQTDLSSGGDMLNRFYAMFHCDRAISHELVRHRVFSFSQQSQRYVNYYNKARFDYGVTFIDPLFNAPPSCLINVPSILLKFACKCTESAYFSFLKMGLSPQWARAILPNCTKTEVFMSGMGKDWYDFYFLRSAKAAHPMMQELAAQIKNQIPSIFEI